MSNHSDLPRYLTKRAKAEQHNVSTKTIDRWREQGLIKAPKIVNGRCYFDAADEPPPDKATTTETTTA